MKLFVGRDVKNAHIHIRNLASLKMLCREYPQLIKTKVSTCPHQLRFCFDIVSFLFGASTQRIKRMGRATKKTLTEKVNIVTCTPYFNQLLQILQNINVLDSDIHFFPLSAGALVKTSGEVCTPSFKHRQLFVALAYRINLMVDFFPAHSPVHNIHKLEFYCIHLFIC